MSGKGIAKSTLVTAHAYNQSGKFYINRNRIVRARLKKSETFSCLRLAIVSMLRCVEINWGMRCARTGLFNLLGTKKMVY